MLPTTLSAKKQTGSSFLAKFSANDRHKGVLFDEINANCGIVDSFSFYLA